MPSGRHTSYTEEIGIAICVQLAEGKSLRSICAKPDMPAIRTVYQWLVKQPTFAQLYARAREDQADTYADEIVDISDDGRNDWMEARDGENVAYKFNGEHVQRSKLRVEARKWIAAKLKAKRYGDSNRVELAGPDGAPLTSVNLTTTDPVEASRVYQQLIGGK